MVLRIRRGTLLDYAKAEELWTATIDLLTSIDQSPMYRMLSKTRHHLLLFAEIDGKIVGAVNAFYGLGVGYIHHLAVQPDYQRCGIGSLLLREMCRQLKERRVRLAILFIPVKSTGKRRDDLTKFYRRNRFKNIGKLFMKKL